MTRYISLGLSCQPRMTIDLGLGKQSRMPFDYCVTEKAALVEALETRGRSFRHSGETAFVFADDHKREGICSDGIYFWHDYPMASKDCVSPDWQDFIDNVNEKYESLWERFSDLIAREPQITFVLSSTHSNLGRFVADDAEFTRKFFIDGAVVDAVAKSLCYDSKAVSLLVTVGSFAEADSVRAAGLESVQVRFLGRTKRPNPLVAESLDWLAKPQGYAARVLTGSYDNGAVVDAQADGSARVFRRKDGALQPWAEVYAVEHGFLFAFDTRDSTLTAEFDGQRLRFSNGAEWIRVRDDGGPEPDWCSPARLHSTSYGDLSQDI